MDSPLFLTRLLADAPPTVGPVAPAAGDLVCVECGLTGGDREDFRWLSSGHGSASDAAGEVVCRLCVLGWTAAWESARVRLALIPDWEQGLLNAVVTLLTVHRLRRRAGEPVPAGIDTVLQSKLLNELQQRAQETAIALPYTASAATLRQTLLALPAREREPVRAELSALRYLPEERDPELARFFNRRRRFSSSGLV
jgi:hypothetical protein